MYAEICKCLMFALNGNLIYVAITLLYMAFKLKIYIMANSSSVGTYLYKTFV